MGFDSPCVTRVIHARPPRRAIDFLQQVGRAERKGQESVSILYYNASDIATNTNTEKCTVDYCRTDRLYTYLTSHHVMPCDMTGSTKCKFFYRWSCCICSMTHEFDMQLAGALIYADSCKATASDGTEWVLCSTIGCVKTLHKSCSPAPEQLCCPAHQEEQEVSFLKIILPVFADLYILLLFLVCKLNYSIKLK